MNEKIYNTEKLLSGAQERKYKLFVQDDYGTWQNTLTGASGYAHIEENVMWSYLYYAAGIKYNGAAFSKRTIPRLKSAKSIKFKIIIYRVSTNISSYNSWEGYFRFCNSFFSINISKSGIGIYVNNTLVANLAERVYYDIAIKQNCFYLDEVRYDFPEGSILLNAPGNECECYAWMSSVNGPSSCGAKLYVQPQDLIVTW